MRRSQTTLTITLFTTGLLVLALLAAIQIGGPIDFLYRGVAGLGSAHSAATLIGLIASALLLLAGFAVAVPTALQRIGFGAKLIAVLPLWLLLFTLAGGLMNAAHIGTVGGIANFGMILVTLAIAWLAVGAVLSTVAVVAAAATAHLGAGSVRAALTLARLAGVVALVAAVATIVTVVMASGSQPSLGRPGGAPGGEGAQPPRPAATAQAGPGVVSTPEVSADGPAAASTESAARGVVSTPEVSAGGPAAASTESAAPGRPSEGGENRNAQGGARQQGGEPGGPPGGPGNFLAGFVQQLRTVGIVVGVLAVIELITLIVGLRAPSPVAIVSGQGYAVGSAIAAFVVVTVIVGAAMQLIQVPHDNPPAQGAIQFDSPQTQALFEGACADCHSNDTKWPWYAYVAPGSWLNAIHVHDAREEMNLSELDAMPSFRRQNLGQSIEMQVRSGNMPPVDYQLMHPAARLTDEQKNQLIEGLKASLAQS